MTRLDDSVKLFITQSLACFDSPSMVVEAVKEEFGITLERSHVQAYDPNRAQGKALSKKWRDIFNEARQAVVNESLEIPIASKVYRLRSLQRMHDFYLQRKNLVQAQSVLEQAAKEVGGMYNSKVIVAGDKDNPLLVQLTQMIAKNSALPIVHDIEAEIIDQE